jgi:hypothetical protein
MGIDSKNRKEGFEMKKIALLIVVLNCSFLLLFNSFAAAADSKEMIGEIFETKEQVERSVRSGKWSRADRSITILIKQMKELVTTLQLSDADKYLKQIDLVGAGMHKAVADRDDEAYEAPAHAMMNVVLNVMEQMNYPSPPVFVIMKRQVEESLELLEEGDFEAIEEEMEEIVNLRKEARKSAKKAGINPDKVNVLLDLAWDVSMDSESKNVASAQKRLERMKKILETV